MLPWVCSVIGHRGRRNVVRTSVTNSPATRVPLLCFYHILTSSVIYCLTDAQHHGMYLLNRSWETTNHSARNIHHIGPPERADRNDPRAARATNL